MLEVYGALSSNVSIWSKTTSVHGYVETAAYRLGRAITEERCNRNKIAIDDHASESPHNQAVHLFILIDVLRSIHYGLPATLAIPEFIYEPISLNEEFIDIYTSIVFNSRLPSQTASLDAAFLALVAILSDIHSLSTVFHSLNAIKLSPLGGTEDGTAVDEDTSQFSNPYVPFSPANENREVKGTLGKALDLWSQRYLEQVDKSVIALYYFCKLYLALPSIQLLPIVAGYHPRRTSEDEEFDYQAKALDHDLRNCNNFECLKYVWLILDHTKRSEELTPLWLPIVLFFSALMVWRMIHLQREPGIYGSLRVLKLFKAELEGMEWPCCQPMAELLESLIR
ncbi:hypothetical protein F5884DRAFT_505101 [Xylogone sp. PMI_703]|nr:hypothetical protein F5884DRAFT_505101 [Xylogone sp. PMI_703]